MTVTVKNKTRTPLVVPPAGRRLAGHKNGEDLEFRVSGGVITIAPKLSPDELQDAEEIRDPRIRAVIRKGHEEFLAGKTRPAEALLGELQKAKARAANRSKR
jgi:bifunctional DNA-binding transcriptional regulator/antitoxin component of YhaV-PrlF toxin-antitoxin module